MLVQVASSGMPSAHSGLTTFKSISSTFGESPSVMRGQTECLCRDLQCGASDACTYMHQYRAHLLRLPRRLYRLRIYPAVSSTRVQVFEPLLSWPSWNLLQLHLGVHCSCSCLTPLPGHAARREQTSKSRQEPRGSSRINRAASFSQSVWSACKVRKKLRTRRLAMLAWE